MRAKLSRPTRWLLEAFLIVGIVITVQAWRTRDAASGPVPPFEAMLANGQPISPARWLERHEGSATAFYFWAEWCPICRAMEANIDAAGERWPILTVAMQSGDARQVSDHLSRRGLRWDAAIDAEGSIARRFGLQAVPALVVVDGRGEIRFVELGYTSEMGLRLRLWWAQNTGN
ncbi:MAG: redoxin domain-containing protein [Zoogloeaceae bacterium]|nr:redoxin domain-containing protein [Zoogloeaceae bacterium]